MTKTNTRRLGELLAEARSTPEGVDPKKAKDAVFKDLLDANVYAHVPAQTPPKGRMRFIQFVRPDNGQTVLPFSATGFKPSSQRARRLRLWPCQDDNCSN